MADQREVPDLSLARLFLRFLGFGCLAFGGPVAQIALIRRELVEREGWMSAARFNRLLAVMQVLPGPEAHELCVHLGMRARGRIGGLLAGLGFMLPGFVLMMGLSWLYFRLDMDQPWVVAGLFGAQAAVLALIVRAVFKIGGHALTDRWLMALAAATLGATLAGASFWIVLPVSGIAYALIHARRWAWAALTVLIGAGLAWALHDPGASRTVAAGSDLIARVPGDAPAWLLFLAGLKAGLMTFGGAYTAIPFLRADAGRAGWVGDTQFLDGLALSSVLPAPLIIFATFVGYVAGGPWGGVAITAGIFLPAFAFSMIFYDRLEAVLENARLHAFLDGVAAAVVGLIAATAIQLGWGQVTGTENAFIGAAIFAGALAVIWLWKSPLAAPVAISLGGLAGVAALV
ncbi:chromate efflux transporter [Brevundimonas sp.]|uniref:chromate efflux transporter n=1 Tax=Brevundimonas sp. TaxID=1871086 RepID=UPI002D1FA925|nr:chromate efflux transporter [Brevundimonas sp.]